MSKFYFVLESYLDPKILIKYKSPNVYYSDLSNSDESGWESEYKWTKLKCLGKTLESATRYSKTQGNFHLYEMTTLPEEKIIHNGIERIIQPLQIFNYLGLVKDN